MPVIKGVLREELENSLRMKKDYERELAKLPEGSLIKKNIKGHEYYYLVLRKSGEVKFIYKGKNVSEAELKNSQPSLQKQYPSLKKNHFLNIISIHCKEQLL